MTQKSGLAAVLAAITGKQPAGDSIARSDHMSAIETAVTQAFGEGETAGKVLGLSAGTTAERERGKAIMSSEHAKGRETMAAHLAFETDMTAEAAISLLEKSPKGGASRLDGKVPQPKVPAADSGQQQQATAGASWSMIVGDLNKTVARGVRPATN